MNLGTRYLGLELRNPLVAGAGPQNGEQRLIFRLLRVSTVLPIKAGSNMLGNWNRPAQM